VAQHATLAEEQDILPGNVRAKPETDQDETIKTENPGNPESLENLENPGRAVSTVTEKEKALCAIIAKTLDILLGTANNVKMRLVRKESGVL
jgi:hypothetical protein